MQVGDAGACIVSLRLRLLLLLLDHLLYELALSQLLLVLLVARRLLLEGQLTGLGLPTVSHLLGHGTLWLDHEQVVRGVRLYNSAVLRCHRLLLFIRLSHRSSTLRRGGRHLKCAGGRLARLLRLAGLLLLLLLQEALGALELVQQLKNLLVTGTCILVSRDCILNRGEVGLRAGACLEHGRGPCRVQLVSLGCELLLAAELARVLQVLQLVAGGHALGLIVCLVDLGERLMELKLLLLLLLHGLLHVVRLIANCCIGLNLCVLQGQLVLGQQLVKRWLADSLRLLLKLLAITGGILIHHFFGWMR